MVRSGFGGVCDKQVRISHKKTHLKNPEHLCMFCACVYTYKFGDNYIFVSMGEIRNISYRIYSQVTNADLSSGETGQKVSP